MGALRPASGPRGGNGRGRETWRASNPGAAVGGVSAVGDLGRRVAERRRQLGLTSAQVADRAGMDPGYLESVEASPSAQLSRSALWRLAAALDLSVDDLTGSGALAPPGRARPSGRPSIETMTVDECKALVGPGGVGRVVFADEDGPAALPVNFGMVGDDVVFRTEPGAGVLSCLGAQPVAFEVDHLDEALTEGWSVLMRGTGRVVEDPAEREEALTSGATPWAAGDRSSVVRIAVSSWSGRRIRERSGGA
jgi:nitroimidazol reductase NimA-like FMN-containing flavoprotein (pyridoxamine 5'-phosphate oxidase superfamily)